MGIWGGENMERGVTEEEIAILEEIRDGKSEIALDLKDGVVQNGIIICMWYLQNDVTVNTN